jgi:hypothetical protein
MKARVTSFLVLLAILLIGCAGTMEFDAAKKTTQLQPGMSYQEVVQLLGEPKSSQMSEGKWVVRWSLHEIWKGWVPYDMVFDPQKKTLLSWTANEEEYQKNQQQMAQWLQGATTGGGVTAASLGPNDPTLMRQIAGRYYSYSAAGMGTSSGTERHLVLCPGGTYKADYESGYSGGAGTGSAWSAVGEGGYGGTWRIQGNMQHGTIVLVDSTGEVYEHEYSSCGRGCYYFGGVKYGFNGAPNCP